MRNLLKCAILGILTPLAFGQVPAPRVPLTGNIGAGGIFPLLNNGTLHFTVDADHTMTYPEMSANFIRVVSDVPLTAQRKLIAPLSQGFQFTIENATTGGQNIQVIGVTGVGVTITNGDTITVASDGTNYVATTGNTGVGVYLPLIGGTMANNAAIAFQGTGAATTLANLGAAGVNQANTYGAYLQDFSQGTIKVSVVTPSPGTLIGNYALGNYPEGTAVDSVGNVWVLNHTDQTIMKYTQGGTLAATYSTVVAGQSGATYLTIDKNDYIWYGVFYTSGITKMSPAGTIIGTYVTGQSGSYPGAFQLAADANNNIWVVVLNDVGVGKGALVELSQAGTILNTISLPGNIPEALNFDAGGNVWVAYGGSAQMTEVSLAGSIIQTITVPAKTVSNNNGNFIFDLSGNIWIADAGNGTNSIYIISPSGTTLQTISVGAGLQPTGLAIDPLGNVWGVDNVFVGSTAYHITEYSPAGKVLNTYTGANGTPRSPVINRDGTVWTTVYPNSGAGYIIRLAGSTVTGPPTPLVANQPVAQAFTQQPNVFTKDNAFGDALVDVIPENTPQFAPNSTAINIGKSSTGVQGANTLNLWNTWNPSGGISSSIAPFSLGITHNFNLDNSTGGPASPIPYFYFMSNFSNTVASGEAIQNFIMWNNFGSGSMWGNALLVNSGNWGTGLVPGYVAYNAHYQNGGWSASVTYVSGAMPTYGMMMTGSTSGATAYIGQNPATWAAGTNTIQFYTKSGTFQAETVTFSNGAVGTISGDLSTIGGATYYEDGGTPSVIGGYVSIARSPSLAQGNGGGVALTPANCGGTLAISGFSGTSGTLTFTTPQWSPDNTWNSYGLYPGETITLTGFSGGNTGLNTQVVTVLEAGLASTQFEATVIGSGYSSGAGKIAISSTCVGVQIGYTVAPLAQTGVGKTFAYSQSGTSDVNWFAGHTVAGGGLYMGTKWTNYVVLPSTLTGYHGSGAGDVKVQLSDGTGTSAYTAEYNSTGGLTNGHAIASANTASAIVVRDGSGNFSAGTITAALTGTASANAGTGSCTNQVVTAENAHAAPTCTTVTSAYVDTSVCSNASCGQNTSGTASNVSGTPALPNGTTATEQAANSADGKLATDSYVDRAVPQGAWSQTTPTPSSQNGSLGSGNSTIVRVQTIGKSAFMNMQVFLGASGAGTGTGALKVGMPFTVQNSNGVSVSCVNNNTEAVLSGTIISNTLYIFSSTGTTIIANSFAGLCAGVAETQ